MNDRRRAEKLAAAIRLKTLRTVGTMCRYHGNASCDCANRKAKRQIRAQKASEDA